MRVRAGRVIAAVVAAAWASAISGTAVHADEGWVITSFHSDITIATSSALTVTEDIRVDFGSLQKHGIFRTIPLRYRYDATTTATTRSRWCRLQTAPGRSYMRIRSTTTTT